MGDGVPSAAAAYLSGQPGSEAAEAARVLRAAIGAHSSADVLAATHPIGLDLAQLMRGLPLIDRVPGWKRAPFRVRTFAQTAGARARFVAGGAALPVYAMGFDAAKALQPATCGAIITQTAELFAQAPQLADEIVPADLAAACAAGIDAQFLDITTSPTDSSPGFIGDGAELLTSTGASVAAIDGDLQRMLRVVTAGGHSLRTAVWAMHSRIAAALAGMRSGGVPAFPGTTADGGRLLGLPVLATPQAPLIGSPQETIIVLLVGEALRVADDNQTEILISRGAVVQQDDAPTQSSTTPTASAAVSMFQTNGIAIRGVRWINWRLADPTACAVLAGVAY